MFNNLGLFHRPIYRRPVRRLRPVYPIINQNGGNGTDIFYNNITVKFNNILILFDNANNIWFSYCDILNSLGYKYVKIQKQRLDIDNKYFDSFKNILINSTNNNIDSSIASHRMKMINESGLYVLLNHSNKVLIKKYRIINIEKTKV